MVVNIGYCGEQIIVGTRCLTRGRPACEAPPPSNVECHVNFTHIRDVVTQTNQLSFK